MLSILAEMLSETGSGPVLEPISKPILEPVSKPIHGELSRFCFQNGFSNASP